MSTNTKAAPAILETLRAVAETVTKDSATFRTTNKAEPTPEWLDASIAYELKAAETSIGPALAATVKSML